MRRFLAVLLAMAILLPSFSYTVGGDGVPITTTKEQLVRENLQLAYVDVGKEKESMHLFLNVVSLDPGEDLTILIPLRTHPENMEIRKMNSSDFLDEYGFSSVESTWEKQNRGVEHVAETMKEGKPYFLASSLFGISGSGMLYLLNNLVGNMGSTGSGVVEHYYSDGMSVDVYSFNSSDSLMAMYDFMGITVPPQSEDIIDKYGNYSVAVVNTVTKPPIPEEEWDFLESNFSWAIDELKEYVKDHPYLEVYDYLYEFDDPQLQEIRERVYEEERDRDTGRSWDAWEYFTHLVLSTYGLGNMKGFEISMDLRFYDGKAFFPLGTSPAWGGITTTKVMFSIDGSRHLYFDRDMKEAFYGGKHYYLWDMNDGTVDYDLEADVIDSGAHTKYISAKTQEIVYDHATVISAFLFITAVALAMGPVVYISDFRKKGRSLTRKGLPGFIGKTYRWAILFFIGGIFIAGAVIYREIYDRKLIKTQKRRKWRYPKIREYRISSILAVTFVLLLPFIMLVPLLPSIEYSLFMSAIHLTFMSVSYYLLYLSTKRPPFDEIMEEGQRERFRKWIYVGISFAGMADISSIHITLNYGTSVSTTGVTLFMSGILVSYFILLVLQDRLGYVYGSSISPIRDEKR